MTRRLLLAAAAIGTMGAGDAVAQDMPLRSGQPLMASDGVADRDGLPVTLAAPPPAADPALLVADRFSTAYARAGRPRIVVFWNRELTDDVESMTEEVTTLTADSSAAVDTWGRERVRRRGLDAAAGGRDDRHLDAELRSQSRRIDVGRRDTPHAEAADFDIERGFTETLARTGARLMDRTALIRSGALGSDTANVQAIETRALLTKADWTLEVVAMGDGRWRITMRDVADGRIVARTASAGQPPAQAMRWVPGERGFVRAAPRRSNPYDIGRQLAVDAMEAMAQRR